MGCINSHNPYKLEPKLHDWRPQLSAIGLDDPDITRFHKLYWKLKKQDLSLAKTVQLSILMSKIDTDPNNFLIRLLSIFKPSQQITGTIDDFREFCFALWNFGTLDEISTGALRRMIDTENLTKLVKESFGHFYTTNSIALKLLDLIVDKYLNQDAFIKFCRTHPQLLYSITVIELKFRKKIFGESIWSQYRKCRLQMTEEYLYSCFARINPSLAHTVVEGSYRRDVRGGASPVRRPSGASAMGDLMIHRTPTMRSNRSASSSDGKEFAPSRRSSINSRRSSLNSGK
eukprot:gene9937-20662_t